VSETSSLKYTGKAPTATTDITRRLAIDNTFAGGTQRSYVDNKVATGVTGLARTDYVDAADNNAATPAYYQQQDGLLIPNAQKAAANGVASLDSGSKIPVAQIPAFGAGNIQGPFGTTSRTTGTAGQGGSFTIANWTLSAPGFSWRPLIFASAIISGAGSTRPCLEARLSGTLIGFGWGFAYNGYQAVSLHPAPDITSQSGNPPTSYSGASTPNISLNIVEPFNNSGTSVTFGATGYLVTAVVYLVKIG